MNKVTKKWIRLPSDGKRCEVSSLSRAALNRLIKAHQDEILWCINAEGKDLGVRRGAILISADSLSWYFERRAIEQWALRRAQEQRRKKK